MIDILLPNNVLGSNVVVVEGLPAGCDILIGMNIIQAGDFHISNHDGKTEFSFCMPPHENRIDLVEKSDRVNERIKRNFKRYKLPTEL